MTRNRLVVRALSAALVAQVLATARADAYIDPGSGSFFVQMLLAGLLGAGMAIKAYWHRIKAFFTGKKTTPDHEMPRQAAGSEDEPSDS